MTRDELDPDLRSAGPAAADSADAVFTEAEAAGMRRALEAALEGPRSANPLVGAVLLSRSGEILHVGRHLGAGTPHAEADVLEQARRAGTDLSDATILVTLEPCDHTGRTGPCSQAILAAGIPRAVFAIEDPQEGAGGARRLRAAGVDVRSGLLAPQARRLNDRWFAAGRAARPFVTAKIAQSLDGRIAAPDGTSQWITGPESRAWSHGVRVRVDAILAGTGTVLADDPRLTARVASAAEGSAQPLRVVVGHREVPAGASVRGEDGRFLHLRTHDPAEALAELHARGIRHVLVEGGSVLTSAFLGTDLVDELLVHQAPLVLGAGRSSLELPGVSTLGQARAFVPDPAGGGALRPLGDDLLWHLRPAADPSDPSDSCTSHRSGRS